MVIWKFRARVEKGVGRKEDNQSGLIKMKETNLAQYGLHVIWIFVESSIWKHLQTPIEVRGSGAHQNSAPTFSFK